jgi:hypothetical protein
MRVTIDEPRQYGSAGEVYLLIGRVNLGGGPNPRNMFPLENKCSIFHKAEGADSQGLVVSDK